MEYLGSTAGGFTRQFASLADLNASRVAAYLQRSKGDCILSR